jgi:hypothetical protein
MVVSSWYLLDVDIGCISCHVANTVYNSGHFSSDVFRPTMLSTVGMAMITLCCCTTGTGMSGSSVVPIAVQARTVKSTNKIVDGVRPIRPGPSIFM